VPQLCLLWRAKRRLADAQQQHATVLRDFTAANDELGARTRFLQQVAQQLAELESGA
jgi:hypothetical protein